ncbi:HD-GYP domain-containing protein [Miltoncostaea marina]|uniref:HD-GYP domain-containing protein n=1 Tax=Miltoncostaea marina TaxID=2843215 RepID=UPI001C3E1AC8|nr:HD domain-containing phosphohydrolase [Miltoncostaea marina]
MIDWFPPTSSPDPAKGLARWQGAMHLRRVARSMDARDAAGAGHSERVAELAADIAAALGWTPQSVDDIREAGHVHDVGKVSVPEAVLLTPGRLTPAEYDIVKVHAAVGAQMAAAVLGRHQVSWIRHHHERWDGRGYPDRLADEEIPQGAQVLAVADAWDAMRHRAFNGRPLDEAEALDECRREAGHQFAPAVVAALEQALERRAAEPRIPSPRHAPHVAMTAAV